VHLGRRPTVDLDQSRPPRGYVTWSPLHRRANDIQATLIKPNHSGRLSAVAGRHRVRSPAGAHPTTTMPPVIVATPMPVAMGSYNGTRGGSHCRAASASDRTANDSTSHGAASWGALCHDISYGHGKSQHQED
jgi:hypothetical protein